jgi:hypothetical protein
LTPTVLTSTSRGSAYLAILDLAGRSVGALGLESRGVDLYTVTTPVNYERVVIVDIQAGDWLFLPVQVEMSGNFELCYKAAHHKRKIKPNEPHAQTYIRTTCLNTKTK